MRCWTAWYCLLGALLLGSCARQPAADRVFLNGKVVTVDGDFRIAQAVATKGDRIVAVGSNQEVQALAGSGAEQIDLAGRMMLPGLIDSHVHALGSAMYEFDHEVPEMGSIADVLAYVQDRSTRLGPDKWVYVSQVFITRLKDQRYPTRAELDAVAPANPVVFRTGPDTSLNTMALRMSGIDRNFQAPAGEPCRVEKDPQGEPTGILRQCARFIRMVSSEREATDADRIARLKLLFEDYNSVGITGVGEGNTDRLQLDLLRSMKDDGELNVRVFSYLAVSGLDPIEDIEQTFREAAQDPLHRKDNMLWLRGIKVFLDGGMLTGSAYMRSPWGVSPIYSITDPAYRGMRYIEPAKLERIMRAAAENELQLTAHAVGDGAVETFVDAAVSLARQGVDIRAARPSLSHANFMGEDIVAKMAEYGVVANMQPNWLQLDGATLMKHFGPERTRWFQPFRALFDQKVMVGGGSDHMQRIGSLRSVNQYNPFLGMWTTIARTPRWMDTAFHPQQAITRQEAIRLYTINNAYLTFSEAERGSIEPGKLADLIVVDRDLLECPLEDLPHTQVLNTYLGGVSVYTRTDATPR
ncbi:MAG: amidohydrolase [Bryobacterales bacterium]|nr:amidohydrolase [Bryobacterales bacterium]